MSALDLAHLSSERTCTDDAHSFLVVGHCIVCMYLAQVGGM